MMQSRIVDHPVLGKWEPQRQVVFEFDGMEVQAFDGDTIASALLAAGVRTLRVHEESGNPRGIYCNIGHCYECRVTVNGKSGVRACLTPIVAGMAVASGKVLPSPLKTEHPEDREKLPRTYAEFARQAGKEQGGNSHG